MQVVCDGWFFFSFPTDGDRYNLPLKGGGGGNMICRPKKYLRSADLHTKSGLDPELHDYMFFAYPTSLRENI